MKKPHIVGIFVVFLVISILTGCDVEDVNIQLLTSPESAIKSQQAFSLSFNVINPTENTFIGNITYDYNEKCLRISGLSSDTENIEVPPKVTENGKRAVVKEFEYVNRDSSIRNFGQSCFQIPLKITVYIFDKGGSLKDSDGVTLIITE